MEGSIGPRRTSVGMRGLVCPDAAHQHVLARVRQVDGETADHRIDLDLDLVEGEDPGFHGPILVPPGVRRPQAGSASALAAVRRATSPTANAAAAPSVVPTATSNT
ncbi:hypothetical protein GCM10009798_24160 [Nocardioides panacihumi]|uniref:Sulfurtransferase TusA family protein n=1 Tax=Nocardioides panacihumi TaxID=400774 RepID=A0ABP5CFN5_9ACTN